MSYVLQKIIIVNLQFARIEFIFDIDTEHHMREHLVEHEEGEQCQWDSTRRSFSRAGDSLTFTNPTAWINPHVLQSRSNFGNGKQCAHDLWDKDYNTARMDYKLTNRLDFIAESETSMPFLVNYAMPTPHVLLVEPPENNCALCEYVVEHWRHKFCDMLR